MEKSWKELNNIISEYKSTVSKRAEIINNTYDDQIKRLKEEKQALLDDLKKEVDVEINDKGYDLEVNPFILFSEVAFEIGQKVLVEKRQDDDSFYESIFGENYNDERFVFDLKITDYRDGIYGFVCDKATRSLFPGTFEHYFKIVEVLEAYEGKRMDVPIRK